jgi:hypothetical protein
VHAAQTGIGDHLGRKPGGGEGVDGDAVRGPFHGKLARHIGHGPFRRRIANGFVDRIGAFTQNRGDINDPSALSACDHLLSDFLTTQKYRRQVDIERLLPPVERMAFGTTDRGYASVVHQNIDRPQGLLGLLQRRVNLRFVAKVSLDGVSPYAERLKLFGDCL